MLFIGATFTGSYLSDSISSHNNNVVAGTWEVGPGQGDVVINELMWPGSVGHTYDEWIELRNMTGSAIDISGWQLTKVNSGGEESDMITISSGSVDANGIFLISNYDQAGSAINVMPDIVSSNVDLSNSNLKIRLYKGDWTNSTNLIDTAGDGGLPPAGLNDNAGARKQSMSRKTTPSDGWYTDTTSNSLIYWDGIDGNYGTPGGTNGL